ncbi:DUF1569 domain-containing protein [Flagellimonas eckloniae]|uniref:DUF1569 domain-containing protein n=1 Tax=Flagellimonas eckloniae TaxID=346185 RepID=A0A0Q1HCN9_9FLAO|nr:DUF1569 domain-containing protein [Allomuricauda eckloniae]KQC31216.1 hypothetical protein AAY42_15970 [Allomuricauda eckloniae]
MKSLFDSEAHSEILDRITSLSVSSKGEWGQMEVGQMLFHCQFPLKLALGRYTMEKPSPVMKLLFKSFKKNMYNDKLWKPNSPTAKGFKVVDKKEFDPEQKNLVTLVNDFHAEKDRTSWEPHPAFGVFTHDQWGQMQYKHLDHHLRQFGV